MYYSKLKGRRKLSRLGSTTRTCHHGTRKTQWDGTRDIHYWTPSCIEMYEYSIEYPITLKQVFMHTFWIWVMRRYPTLRFHFTLFSNLRQKLMNVILKGKNDRSINHHDNSKLFSFPVDIPAVNTHRSKPVVSAIPKSKLMNEI